MPDENIIWWKKFAYHYQTSRSGDCTRQAFWKAVILQMQIFIMFLNHTVRRDYIKIPQLEYFSFGGPIENKRDALCCYPTAGTKAAVRGIKKTCY